MNAVVIGASEESIYAIQRAKQMGIFVIALDGDPNAQGLPYASKSFVVDIRIPSLIYNILDSFIPQLVIPTPIGKYLTSVGAVNDHYCLQGITQHSAKLCIDKHLFHKALSQQGIRNIRHTLVSKGTAKAIAGSELLRYPAIVKPRYGSGSRLVKICLTQEELQKYFAQQEFSDEDFVIEDCVDGKEYGVDAAIINGKFYLILLREKLLTPYPYRQCVGYYSLNQDSCADIYALAKQSLDQARKVLKIDNCLLHADIIHNHNEIFIIEMSARPSGHNLHNLFTPMSTGVDMIYEYLKYLSPSLKETYSFVPAYTKCLLIKYFDFTTKKILKTPSENHIYKNYPVKAYKCNLKKGMALQRVTDSHSVINRGYYIIEGKDRNHLNSISKNIDNEFIMERG